MMVKRSWIEGRIKQKKEKKKGRKKGHVEGKGYDYYPPSSISNQRSTTSWEDEQLLRKAHILIGGPFFFHFLGFYCCSWHHTTWNIILIILAQISWWCLLHISCSSSTYWPLRGRLERQLWYGTNTTQQQPKHWWDINTVLATSAHGSTVWSAREKANFILARFKRGIFNSSWALAYLF